MQNYSKLTHFFGLLVLVLITGIIFTITGFFLASIIWDVSFSEVSGLMNLEKCQENSNPLKFLQLFNSLGLFLIPAILYSYLFMNNRSKDLRIENTSPLFNYVLVVLLFITLIPIVNYSVKLNEAIELPQFLSGIEQWMKNAEASAKELTVVFLKMNSLEDLLLNIVLIAIIPALGEELIFRGIIQRIFNQGKTNYHIGIWCSAIIFSAIHFQFYGFIPRMLLGAFFGYLLVWSGSLWLPIFAHFINNATGVIGAYIYGASSLDNEIDQIGSTDGSEYLSFISLILFGTLLYHFRKAQKNPALGGI